MKGTDTQKENKTPLQGEEEQQENSASQPQREDVGAHPQRQRRATAESVRRAPQQRPQILPRDQQPAVYQGYVYNYSYADQQQQWGIAAVQNNPYYW